MNKPQGLRGYKIRTIIFLTAFFCLWSFALLTPSPAHPQSIEEQLGLAPAPSAAFRVKQAERYNQTCLQKHSEQTERVRTILCACTSSRIFDHLNDSALRVMLHDAEDGQIVKDKIHNEYYIPCTAPAVKAQVMEDCLNSPALKNNHKRGDICPCIADKMERYVAVDGRYIIGDKRSDVLNTPLNPDAPNPLSALLTSRDFLRRYNSYSAHCVQKHTIWQENFR